MTRRRVIPIVAAAMLISSCSLRSVSCGTPPALQAPPADQAATPSAPGAPAEAAKFKIAFLGDSLTAGLNLVSQQAYPAVIEEMFGAEGYTQVESVNAGISGDTTAGGRRRVEQVFEPGVRILVVALGGNDALRGLSPSQTRENLKAIIDAARAKGVSVVLCGMEAPANLGPDYRDAFHEVFPGLAQEYRDIKFMPFLLAGVAGEAGLNQADGIHPNEQGARVIAEHLYPTLRTLVDELGGGG